MAREGTFATNVFPSAPSDHKHGRSWLTRAAHDEGATMALSDYEPTREELIYLGEIGGFEVHITDEPAGADTDAPTGATPDSDPGDDNADFDVCLGDGANLAREISRQVISDPDGFAEWVAVNRERIIDAARLDQIVSDALVVAYKMRISDGDADCMNDLGALYYMGEIVPQDYDRAAELYTMAADNGCYQSIINLGYIHEYGRTGTPDPQAAYRCYALAAALAPSSEALCKLGDMYSRGKAVPRNVRRAHDLWERSLEQSTTVVETAQPAIRIAQLLVGSDRELVGLEPDPLRALSLFQQAEVGLRIDIANGASYYRKLLQHAIDGQQQARDLMDLLRLE